MYTYYTAGIATRYKQGFNPHTHRTQKQHSQHTDAATFSPGHHISHEKTLTFYSMYITRVEKQQEIHHGLMDAIKLMNKISYKPRNTKIRLHKMPHVEIEDASTMYMKYGMYLHVHVPFSFSRLDQRLTYTLHNHKIVQE